MKAAGLPDTMVTRRQDRAGWRRSAILAPLLLLGAATGPAQAQFSWFGPREASAQDVSETIAEHGFTLVGPLYRNGRVYLADVLDRRRRRERLVISAESGEIVQRYFVDVGQDRRAPALTARPAPRDDSFFSHLTRGWDDEPPPRPPVGLPDQGGASPFVPSRPKPLPRALTRTEAPAAVTSSPLPPPTGVTAPTVKPETVKVPATTALAPEPAQAPSTVRGTSVSTDPLRIPGTRKAEEARESKPVAPAAVAATKPADPAPAAAAAKPKPTGDVPVAPLD